MLKNILCVLFEGGSYSISPIRNALELVLGESFVWCWGGGGG